MIGSQNSTRSKSRSRRKHSIDVKLPYNEKVESIISSGVSFSEVLKEDIFKADVKDAEKIVREKFQLQEDDVMHGEFLTDYNIMPRDVLELFSTEALTALCEAKEVLDENLN